MSKAKIRMALTEKNQLHGDKNKIKHVGPFD
jgi:hypothetical protein